MSSDRGDFFVLAIGPEKAIKMNPKLSSIVAALALQLAIITTTPALAAVRFVVLGDAGEGNAAQYENGSAIARICAAKGCDLALYLGDNFYDDGLNSFSDPQLETKFERPYADVNIPFYAVLGNHDYGDPPVKLWKPIYQIFYTDRSPKWKMPNYFYKFSIEHVEFFALDTQGVAAGLSHNQQTSWLTNALSASGAQWKIVLGHHPYISNGRHGNAGNYKGCGEHCPDELNGRKLQQLVEGTVCGVAHVYFSGHDHNMQWLHPRCGTEFVISGAGATTVPFRHRENNPVFWESDAHVGFMWVEIDGNRFTGEYYDKNGELLFSRSFTR